VTIFGAEPHVNYNRIMLSPVLAGEKTFDQIVINPRAWYDDNGIELITSDPVTAIDRAARPSPPFRVARWPMTGC
jgi:nitrite reductase (NADH) large subunit